MARNMRKQTQRQQKGAARRQYNPRLPFDPSNPYDTPTPPNSMPPPTAGDFDDDISVVSSSTNAGNMLNSRALSILSTASSFQGEGSTVQSSPLLVIAHAHELLSF
jgi:hypothetical protein